MQGTGMGAARSAGGLRGELTEFVGRRAELAQVRQVLGGARLVTLTGPGGIGKTRLALRTLAMMADEFPDGACYAELADVRNPDLVVTRVAAAIGRTPRAG